MSSTFIFLSLPVLTEQPTEEPGWVVSCNAIFQILNSNLVAISNKLLHIWPSINLMIRFNIAIQIGFIHLERNKNINKCNYQERLDNFMLSTLHRLCGRYRFKMKNVSIKHIFASGAGKLFISPDDGRGRWSPGQNWQKHDCSVTTALRCREEEHDMRSQIRPGICRSYQLF